jgi:hypothetical protein
LSDLERLLRRDPVGRNYAVEIDSVSELARAPIVSFLADRWHLSAEDIDELLEQSPVRLRNNLTKGQAEDIKASLAREKIDVVIRNVEASCAS